MATIYAVFLCYSAHTGCTQFGRGVFSSLADCHAEIVRDEHLKVVGPGLTPVCMKTQVPAWSRAD